MRKRLTGRGGKRHEIGFPFWAEKQIKRRKTRQKSTTSPLFQKAWKNPRSSSSWPRGDILLFPKLQIFFALQAYGFILFFFKYFTTPFARAGRSFLLLSLLLLLSTLPSLFSTSTSISIPICLLSLPLRLCHLSPF